MCMHSIHVKTRDAPRFSVAGFQVQEMKEMGDGR